MDAILFAMGLVGGTLFYAYTAVIFYGLPVSIALKQFGLFNLPMVILASIIPVTALELLGSQEQFRTTAVIFYGCLVVGVGCWYTYLWAFKKSRH